MKVVIVEDEITASDNLKHLLNTINVDIEVLQILDTVKSCIAYFSKPIDASLVFMDIHLADGLSFEIFDHVEINIPIIFTTAYDEYALKAFTVNSIDYILKPIQQKELSKAIIKFENLTNIERTTKPDITALLHLLQEQKKTYKSNYLISHRDELIPIKTSDIAYFYIDTGIIKLVTFAHKVYNIDKKLETLEKELNPEMFDRANRQYIINRNAITKIAHYFGGKLIVNLNPKTTERIIISKGKAREFKDWMNS
ncbi:LytTR family DNA-binding domain-containing protein [uncultured Maribacter sp.]|uniref:LytR/AlgR family response regulator transcription factor n=1 Tax=uncultured Maribacter sp. TaxID=431308 RepID=UPI00260698D6|nr:LytTR family DNA-binding domain-containing protein [uncultured Maribacter sp.]